MFCNCGGGTVLSYPRLYLGLITLSCPTCRLLQEFMTYVSKAISPRLKLEEVYVKHGEPVRTS